jgi:hypothetical protein
MPQATQPKPDWWPKNPYPADIFPLERDRYAEIVPDPDERTTLSGMLGREFWDIASETIWDRYCEAMRDEEAADDVDERGKVRRTVG